MKWIRELFLELFVLYISSVSSVYLQDKPAAEALEHGRVLRSVRQREAPQKKVYLPSSLFYGLYCFMLHTLRYSAVFRKVNPFERAFFVWLDQAA